MPAGHSNQKENKLTETYYICHLYYLKCETKKLKLLTDNLVMAMIVKLFEFKIRKEELTLLFIVKLHYTTEL